VNEPDPDKSASLTLQRGLVAVLSWIRRVLGSVYQLVFRDRLAHIDEQTERLGAASVEAVTHLGGEVRALDARLAAIERELAALRATLEGRAEQPASDADETVARPPAAG
jgi:hypothetical protein